MRDCWAEDASRVTPTFTDPMHLRVCVSTSSARGANDGYKTRAEISTGTGDHPAGGACLELGRQWRRRGHLACQQAGSHGWSSDRSPRPQWHQLARARSTSLADRKPVRDADGGAESGPLERLADVWNLRCRLFAYDRHENRALRSLFAMADQR